MKCTVNQHTYGKFNSRNYEAADKTAKKKIACFQPHIYKINQQKGNAACYRHCPVSVTSGYHLDKTVYYGAKAENRKVFAEICFNQHTITIDYIARKRKGTCIAQVPFFANYLSLASMQ